MFCRTRKLFHCALLVVSITHAATAWPVECKDSKRHSLERRVHSAERNIQRSIARENSLEIWCEKYLGRIVAKRSGYAELSREYLPFCEIAQPSELDSEKCRKGTVYASRVASHDDWYARSSAGCAARSERQKGYTRRAREKLEEFSAELAQCEEEVETQRKFDGNIDRSIPHLSEWEGAMVRFGRLHCDKSKIDSLSTWEGSVWYYDGILVYYNIGDYTGDPSWAACARYVRDVYRRYVLSSGGVVPGWRVFPWGLYEDFSRTGSQESKTATLELATKSAFADEGGGRDFTLSRETAYVIHAYLAAEAGGAGRKPNLAVAVANALSHLEQWSVLKSAEYVQPFMVGLTFEALIKYHERTGDNRILPAVRQAADWLWANTWNSAAVAFRYIKCKPGYESQNHECTADYAAAAADLNLLIAPAYAWLYAQTGDTKYRDWGDQIFAGGVKDAWLGGGKQFSQSYRWSFDYVRWRSSR